MGATGALYPSISGNGCNSTRPEGELSKKELFQQKHWQSLFFETALHTLSK